MSQLQRLSVASLSGHDGVVGLCSCPSTGQAQTATGGIRGTVSDAAEAAIPGATITARNPATGAESKTVTNSEGLYTLPRLLPGRYTCRSRHPTLRSRRSPMSTSRLDGTPWWTRGSKRARSRRW
jgi:hypothetical protein